MAITFWPPEVKRVNDHDCAGYASYCRRALWMILHSVLLRSVWQVPGWKSCLGLLPAVRGALEILRCVDHCSRSWWVPLATECLGLGEAIWMLHYRENKSIHQIVIETENLYFSYT